MTAALQTESSTLPCPKTGCAGQMGVAQTWPGKIEKFRNVQLECPVCHLRDFQNFPVPDRVSSADCLPFEFGHVVEHAVHGRGMVIYSGPNFTRVCFQGQKGKESEVLTYDLKLAQDAEELNAYRKTLERTERILKASSDPKTPPGHRAFMPGIPDANPDDLPGSRDMRCELCDKDNFKLVFIERLWVCEDCRDSVDIGDKVVRGSK